MSFNPLAGNFSTTQTIYPEGDYDLKIVGVEYKMIGNDDPKPVLTFKIAFASGDLVNKRPSPIQVWEPEADFAQAGRIIVSALGYKPGKDDTRFVAENPELDITLDSSDPKDMKLGAGFKQLEGTVFKASLGLTTSKKNGQTYQSYKNIRPLNED